MMYRLIDAESYRGQKLLIVGGGDSAVEAAIGLAQQPDNEVTLSYRRDKLVRIKKKNEDRFAPLVAAGRIKPDLRLAGGGGAAATACASRSGAAVHELPNDYVFVFAGGEPPFDFLKHCGVRFGGPPAPGRAAARRLGRLARVAAGVLVELRLVLERAEVDSSSPRSRTWAPSSGPRTSRTPGRARWRRRRLALLAQAGVGRRAGAPPCRRRSRAGEGGGQRTDRHRITFRMLFLRAVLPCSTEIGPDGAGGRRQCTFPWCRWSWSSPCATCSATRGAPRSR